MADPLAETFYLCPIPSLSFPSERAGRDAPQDTSESEPREERPSIASARLSSTAEQPAPETLRARARRAMLAATSEW